MKKKKQQSNGTHESPLKLFGEAKEKINEIFSKLDKCVSEAKTFYQSNYDQDTLRNVDTNRLHLLNKSIATIRGVLARNQMKVAFFGRTSNGKSTVINAILHDKVLPMGYGHVTGCFLEIQGNSDNEAYIKSGEERKPIQSVAHIANAMKPGSLECSTLVKIFWPISKCSLLKYDVVLVDSPGVDNEKNLDQWIDEHCHDADVFVLVSNAESSLAVSEREFFHKVSEKLSKPNIFILNNRWDVIAEDKDSTSEEVKEKHIEKAIHFLSDDLKISTQEDARRRTFFVSAREILRARSDPNSSFNQERVEEFEKFERCFEESLSKSAVQTKFKKHTDKGKETINELTNILNSTLLIVTDLFKKKMQDLEQNEFRCKNIHSRFYANKNELQGHIVGQKKSIHIALDKVLDNEIRRLSRIVEDFDESFSPRSDRIEQYKEKLYLHVEESLCENLQPKITSLITKHVNPFTRLMCDMSQMLSKEREQKLQHIVTTQSYIDDDLLDLRNYMKLYTGFQEDLEFRFSLSIFSIIRRFQSKFSVKSNSLDQSQVEPDYLSIIERLMMVNSPQSPTAIGSLAVAGVLVRTVGLRYIVIVAAAYGSLYAYEYLTWTNSAKERALKAQYVKYAKKGLQDCVPIISQVISNNVKQKMLHTFAQVEKDLDVEKSEIENNIKLLRGALEKLQKCEEFTKKLIGENNVIMTELVAFATSFLFN